MGGAAAGDPVSGGVTNAAQRRRLRRRTSTISRRRTVATVLIGTVLALAAWLIAGTLLDCDPTHESVPATRTHNPDAVLSLPKVPWFGGPSYYKNFPKAAGAGWSDPSFFPIAVFMGKPEHAAALAAAGINTFTGIEHDGFPISTATKAGISVIPQQGEWSVADVGDDPGVVGWFLSDECEMGLGGCTEVDDEYARLADQKAFADTFRALNDGRFLQANFGNGVIGDYWAAHTMPAQTDLLDVTTVDKYAYTSPHVRRILENGSHWADDLRPRSSAAYGWMQERMDGFSEKTKPNWVLVETAMPFLDETDAETISADEIEGAVWSSIINGAAGVAYFQHNNNGLCGVYSILECGSELKSRITELNHEVQALAPILNTQSYRWTFGKNLQTSLKVSGSTAYLFAMTSGGSGVRTFALPPDLAKAESVTVVGEGRSIPVTDGVFADSFAREFTHHIYAVDIG